MKAATKTNPSENRRSRNPPVKPAGFFMGRSTTKFNRGRLLANEVLSEIGLGVRH